MDRFNRTYLNMKRAVLKSEKYILAQLEGIEYEDLAVAELAIIDAIGIDGEKTITEIADILEVSLSTPTKAMDRLVNKGYIVRETSKKDRRVVLSKLTSKGNDIAGKLAIYRQELFKKFFEDIAKEDVDKFDEILISIVDVLE